MLPSPISSNAHQRSRRMALGWSHASAQQAPRRQSARLMMPGTADYRESSTQWSHMDPGVVRAAVLVYAIMRMVN